MSPPRMSPSSSAPLSVIGPSASSPSITCSDRCTSCSERSRAPGSLELLSSFNMDLSLEILAENRVTKFFSVPTIYVRLSGLPSLREKLGAVRYCFSSASSLPAEIIRQWKAATGITISEGYGMTESASAVTYNHYYLHREASVGQTVPGVEVEIGDASGNRLKEGEEGEICVNGQTS